ncbi:MAG: TIGR00730 family Rossman fold protein [Candidatus Kapabacteria bacterium]|nr:TIGR00730 family Rossman fold protein [Candidatus Kapabacteria bacterium]
MNKTITVYCASSEKIDQKYFNLADNVGRLLAEHSFDIIYGGGRVGMMGRVADAAKKANGIVKGVIPDFMISLELAHEGLDELHVVEDMHKRQFKMMTDTDYILVLPGGCGTILEFIEAITWKRLGLIHKPVIILNIDGYYDELLAMLEKTISSRFMPPAMRCAWIEAKSVEKAMEIFNKGFDESESDRKIQY